MYFNIQQNKHSEDIALRVYYRKFQIIAGHNRVTEVHCREWIIF